jgi:hypothetical protein
LPLAFFFNPGIWAQGGSFGGKSTRDKTAAALDLERRIQGPSSMNECKICRQKGVEHWLDFGLQPLTNRFLLSAHDSEFEHPLALGVCHRCGTVQLRDRVPTTEMRPRFDWITYNEPESHLDDASRTICGLPGISSNSTIAGLTYKDDSTLQRLNKLGFQKTWRADAQIDLEVDSRFGGIESVQERLSVATAERLASRYGKPDVLLLRHVLEHSHDIHQTVACLKALVAPSGYIVFEMPDARRALERLDYSTVWEEHIFYFSPATLRHFLEQSGFEVAFLESYFYTLENSLVAIAKSAEVESRSAGSFPELPEELDRAERFIREFANEKHRNRKLLDSLRRTHGRIAFLGAGHLSAAFICLYGLQDVVDLVVDDNPKKQGLFMPGSRLPILPSSALIERGIKVCLMGVRPEIEDAVRTKNQPFLDRGGRLVSIFPDSRYSLYTEEPASLRKAG